ncbi:hypothetical protein, partial [Caballeronia arationis]|uniref:hypothetical protein n=1 Tax=Caballeronia arationis TaxID=1777142 RepID=UPI001F278D64
MDPVLAHAALKQREYIALCRCCFKTFYMNAPLEQTLIGSDMTGSVAALYPGLLQRLSCGPL